MLLQARICRSVGVCSVLHGDLAVIYMLVVFGESVRMIIWIGLSCILVVCSFRCIFAVVGLDLTIAVFCAIIIVYAFRMAALVEVVVWVIFPDRPIEGGPGQPGVLLSRLSCRPVLSMRTIVLWICRVGSCEDLVVCPIRSIVLVGLPGTSKILILVVIILMVNPG